ncbi:UDP-glucose 4-epimerase [compost metagenome]
MRDYIHVLDLADAHVRAVEYLLEGGDSVELNLGTGTGTTVKELLNAITEVSGRTFGIDYVDRREGDSTTLVANNDKAREVLGWEPQYDLAAITRTAWNWHSRRNQGA